MAFFGGFSDLGNSNESLTISGILSPKLWVMVRNSHSRMFSEQVANMQLATKSAG